MPGTWAKKGWNGGFLVLYGSPEGLETEFCTIIPKKWGLLSVSC